MLFRSRGAVADDANDVLVLEGEVEDQIALARAMQLAARLFLGEEGEQGDARTALFSNLPAGTHELELRAMLDGSFKAQATATVLTVIDCT